MAENYFLERRSLRQAFDQAAQSYDHVAVLQREAAKHLLARTHPGTPPRRVLDLGCGTGYGGGLLSARYPQAALIQADLSLAMVRAAQSAQSGSGAFCADAQALPLRASSVDLLWSNLMLQWCNDPPQAFAQFHSAIGAGGTLALSSFGPATLGELRDSFDDGYTHLSRFVPAYDLAEQLQDVGFSDIRVETERRVLYYAEVLNLVRELKALGATNATRGRARGLTGRHSWRRMLERYERLRVPQGLPATYELIYVTALKPGKEDA